MRRKQRSRTQKLRRKRRRAAGIVPGIPAPRERTPRARYECKVNGQWVPARARNRRPRVGGHIVTRYRYFGRIDDVREAVAK